MDSNKENKVHTKPTFSNASSSSNKDSTNFVANPSFTSRLALPRKEIRNDEEVLEVFKKVEANFPLLMKIKSIPRYTKFLKELYTHKRRSKSQEKAMVSRNVSSLLKKSLPEKCVDPSMFLLPCTIGNA